MTKARRVVISHSVEVAAPARRVFAATTDWARQGEWMVGTSVAGELPVKSGSKLQAFSGIGRIGFIDKMTITVWEPPSRCEVIHTGAFVRGTGSFIVKPLSNKTSLFIWSESLALPFAFIGQIGWVLVRPAFMFGLRLSLKRFSKWAESYQPTSANNTK